MRSYVSILQNPKGGKFSEGSTKDAHARERFFRTRWRGQYVRRSLTYSFRAKI
jgi:hypothetical protein